MPEAAKGARLPRDPRSGWPDELGQALLFEEFGFPRDGERYAPDATTAIRDR
jgi:hypothetical protein